MAQPIENFGNFILLERIASGGMAEVYLSKSTGAVGVNKFVAIKRILPQYSEHKEFIDMFREEAGISIKLKHSNVVQTYTFINEVESKEFYLIMEFVGGKNLRQILNELKKTNGQLDIEQIVFIIKEVAAGLDHAHHCINDETNKPLNIVHRDMSPQNIMISYDGEIKIIDFGIAKAETQLEATKAGTLKGKYGYMSPEQAEGLPIDPRSDIFSLGTILWELLANDRLFTANNEAAILRKIHECQIPSVRKLNPTVPIELEKIVNKALAKDKSLRYQTASHFHRDLNRFLNTEYPDFSIHDFSVFMKNTFSVAYLELRQKLVEYAQLKNPRSDDKTIVTSTNTKTASNSAAPRQWKNWVSFDADQDGKLDLDTSTDLRVNLENLKNPTKPKPTSHQYPSQNTYTGSAVGDFGFSKKNKSSIPGSMAMKHYFGIAKNMVVTLAVVFGGWWLFEKYSVPSYKSVSSLIKSVHRGSRPVQEPAAEPLEISSQTPEFIVNFYSNPDGARVIINGEDTGQFTPIRKTLKASEPIELRLTKEGYTDLVTTVTPAYEAYSYTGTLQRLAKVGSLVINIKNGGVSPELLIQGSPVMVKPDGSAYLVQAEVPVTIEAKNKTLGLSTSTTVQVPTDQRKIIDLILR